MISELESLVPNSLTTYRDMADQKLVFTSMSVSDLLFVMFLFSLCLSAFVVMLNGRNLQERIVSLFQLRRSTYGAYQRAGSESGPPPGFLHGSQRGPSQSKGANDFLVLLYPAASIIIGLLLFNLFSGLSLSQELSLLDFLEAIVLSVLVEAYFLLKIGIYDAVGWIFLGAQYRKACISTYSTSVYLLTFLLLPVTLPLVFIPVAPADAALVLLTILGLYKVLIFFIWVKLFVGNFYSSLMIILYFCALEIVPLLLLWLGVCQFGFSFNLFDIGN